MSGKFRNPYKIFDKTQVILDCNNEDVIKGVVMVRKNISENKAKELLEQERLNLLLEDTIPVNAKFLEPKKMYVWWQDGWQYEEFALSTIIDMAKGKVYKQRVWFFELENHIKYED